jgi:hypothetical protein
MRRVLLDSDAVTISNQAIRMGGAVYPIAHLTAVKLHVDDRSPGPPVDPKVFGLGCGIGAVLSLLSFPLFGPPTLVVAFGFAGAAVILWRTPMAPRRARSVVCSLDLQFANHDAYRITGSEADVRTIHQAAVNVIGVAKA